MMSLERSKWGRFCLAAIISVCGGSTATADEPEAANLKLLRTFHQEFVRIEPGAKGMAAEFTMGRDDGPPAERPAHKVVLKSPFYMARYEAPQNLWQAVMGGNPSRWQGPRNSVEMISFSDAQEFCRRITKLMREAKLIADEQTVRLPSEAEWEYACRAGTTTVYSFGDNPEELGQYGWFHGNAAGNDPPVGAKKPNAWGLYDMHGYLSEWCADAWHDDYSGASNNSSPRETEDAAPRRVLRGGSWKDSAAGLTSAHRVSLPADSKDEAIGLRCVLTIQTIK